jgi:hypothetical protein
MIVNSPDLPISLTDLRQLGGTSLCRDVTRASALLDSQSDAARRGAIAMGFVLGWNVGQPLEKLLERAEGFGAGRDDVVAAVLSRPRQSQAHGAVEYFHAQSPEFQSRWGAQVAAGLSNFVPERAAELFLTSGVIEKGNPVESAVAAEIVVERLLDRDSVAASEWVGSLPEGLVRDHAILELVRGADPEDAGTAAQWIATIGDQHVRTAAQKAVTHPRRIRVWRSSRVQ